MMAARQDRRSAEGPALEAPTVLLVGTGGIASKVRSAISKIGLSVRRGRQPDVAFDGAISPVNAVVCVAPLPDLSIRDFCMRLRRERGRVPLYVIAGSGMSRRDQVRIYNAGAGGIFTWPGEREAFARALVRTIISPHPMLDTTGARSLALAARVEQRLRQERTTFGPLIRVSVRNGVVYLHGEVDSLWKVKEAESVVSSIQGVKDVMTEGLMVTAGGVPDRRISAAARSVLRNTTDLDASTIALTCSAGHLGITGTAASKREMRRIVEILSHVRGVRSVENLMKVSKESKRREQAVARDIRNALRTRFPEERVQVAVFGKVAVLSGHVSSSVLRRSMEEEASMTAGIEQVVSKLV